METEPTPNNTENSTNTQKSHSSHYNSNPIIKGLQQAAEEAANRKTHQSNPRELLEQIPIEDTPFIALRIDDKWYLTLGKYRLTKELPTLEAVQEETKNTTWMRIMQIIQIMINEHQIKEQEERKAQLTTLVNDMEDTEEVKAKNLNNYKVPKRR